MKYLASAALTLCLVACKPANTETPAAEKAPAAEAPKAEAVAAKPVAPKPAAMPVPEGALPIDTSISKVEWVGAKITGSHPGGFKNFNGYVMLGDDLSQSKVSVMIDTKSIYSDSDKLTGHLMSKDFFEVETYPTAKFVSTKIEKATGKGAKGTHTISGKLELHGVSKDLTFPATLVTSPERVSATSEFTINRKDFGIVYPGMPDDLIKDNVVIKLSVKAQNKKG